MDTTHHDLPALAAALGERAEEVCRRYLPNGRRSGRYWSVGNVDGAKGRSMWVRLEPPGVPGKWVDAATGEHGDLLDIVRHHVGACPIGVAIEEARAVLGLPRARLATADDAASPSNRTETARRLWRACRDISETRAEAYLRARAIERTRFAALRFHPELWYRDEAGTRSHPGLVAAVTTNDGELTGIHRTWLDRHTPAKAPLREPRKALGPIYGNAVSLGSAPPGSGGTLVVGEGIETVLSVLTVLTELSGAAALSSPSLAAFSPPPGLERLIVARDNDAAGEGASYRLVMRCRQLGIATTVVVPEGGDFNDDLLSLGPQALRERLAPFVERGPMQP